MEYIYAALLIHKLGGKLNETTLSTVVKAAGGTPNDAQAKALGAALEGKNIDEAIKNASAVPVAVASAPAGGSAPAAKEKKEEKKEEDKSEEAAAGLGALFG